MKITVEVTEIDIATANPALSDQCPIANTLKRMLPDKRILVDAAFVYINGYRYKATEQYTGVIQDFANLLYSPQTFDIEEAA